MFTIYWFCVRKDKFTCTKGWGLKECKLKHAKCMTLNSWAFTEFSKNNLKLTKLMDFFQDVGKECSISYPLNDGNFLFSLNVTYLGTVSTDDRVIFCKYFNLETAELIRLTPRMKEARS